MKKQTVRKPSRAETQEFPPGWDKKRVKEVNDHHFEQEGYKVLIKK